MATKKSVVPKEIIEEPVKRTGRISRKTKEVDALIDIDRNKVVPVVSVSHFTVGYRCKETNELLVWNEYGQEHYMKVSEIIRMKSDSEKFVKAWLVIDDAEIAEAFKLTELYDTIFELEDLDTFIEQKQEDIVRKLESLPQELRVDTMNRIVALMEEGKIDSIKLIKTLRENFNIEIDV